MTYDITIYDRLEKMSDGELRGELFRIRNEADKQAMHRLIRAELVLRGVRAKERIKRFGKSCQHEAHYRVAEKEPAMNKTIWYGVKDNETRFADTKAALTEQGINDAQSFNVNGEVTGLNLVGHSEQQQSQSQAPQPTA